MYNLYLDSDEYDSQNNPNPNFNFRKRDQLCTDVAGTEHKLRDNFMAKLDQKGTMIYFIIIH